uniref:Uncharacterized protein n=1 Tax=Octopus bimaculoides TaxID=37653 RepID=A0A0L8I2T3_OCTBM
MLLLLLSTGMLMDGSGSQIEPNPVQPIPQSNTSLRCTKIQSVTKATIDPSVAPAWPQYPQQ